MNNKAALTAALVLLLVAAPMAQAQATTNPDDCSAGSAECQDGGEGSNQPPDEGRPCEEYECKAYCEDEYDTDDARKCFERYCSDHPDNARCARDGNATSDPERQPEPDGTEPQPEPGKDDEARKCAEDAETADERRECARAYCARTNDSRCAEPPRPTSKPVPEEDGDDDVDERSWCDYENGGKTDRCAAWKDTSGGLRWIEFDVSRKPPMLTDYEINDVDALDSLILRSGSDEFATQLQRGQGILKLGDGNTVATLHDNPTGLISFKGLDGSLTFVFPEDARISVAPAGLRVQYDEASGVLKTDSYEWLGQHVTVTGFATFHIPPEEPQVEPGRPSSPVGRDVLEDSIKKGHFGAEMNIKKPLFSDPAASAPGVVSLQASGAEILAYDDVDIVVDPLPDVATPDTPFRVTLSSELATGRAFSMTLDPELLPGVDPFDLANTLAIDYFDIADDGTQTPAQIRMASSLEDVLDPSDDTVAEYWIVVDPNGIQVLFMVPHWSVHALSLASLSGVVEYVTQPSVLAGIVSGTVGAIGAGVAMLWPRRRHHETA